MKVLDERITEKDFRQMVLDLATALGWKAYCVFEQQNYARRSSKGFPDLVLVKPPRVIFVELKSEKGEVAKSQYEWLNALEKCTVVEVYVRSPKHWGNIVAMLQQEA